MDYVIYTYGGGEILWKIFNGLSLFFHSDSAYLTGVVKLSLIIGGFWAALRAIYGGNMGILARDYFIPAYLILNLLLLPKTSVHIVDEVSSDFKYSKVDHVPIGIAAVTSTASKLSRFITDRIETSLKTADATHFGKTGPMFAARLVAMSRDMRLVDPVLRQNMKDFVRQCFTLPFVWTNILAGKKAALESQDILGLIASHPHKWLGSYWRNWGDKGGDTIFLYCKDGAAKAREILKTEIPNGLVGLATDLFGSSQMDSVKSSQKLKTYFEGAWQELSRQAASAHNAAGQEMMMNAYREGLDDKRQEFGLERQNPHLTAYSSARARLQQNTGFLISSNLFALVGPSLQSTLFGILCVLFVIVVPMSLLPGGLAAFGMWVKLILWVQSWPVFYAIINCVSLMIASGKAAALVKTGAGLSLMTQNGLADAAYDAYCYAEGFMCMVPVIAWAVISKSGYALANLASTVTRGMDGLTSKMGSDITDGNMSFDNQSFHNRSVAGYQMAQQQLAPNFSFGSRYDDGRMNMTYDTHGHPIIQEAQTNLKTHVVGNDNLSASLTDTAQHSLQASHNYSRMASEQVSQGINELASYARQYSKSEGTSEGFGHTESAGQSQDWKDVMDIAHKIAQQHNISDDKAFKLAVQGGLSTGSLGKALGLNAGVSTDSSVNAQDKEMMDKAKNAGLDKQFSDSLNRALQHSLDHKGSMTDQDQRQSLDSIQGSFSKARSWQEQAQSSLQESDTFSKAASLVEGSSLSSTTNWDDQVLAYAASRRGESVQQTAHWQSENPDAYRQYASEFMADKQQAFINSLKSGHALSEDQIREKFEGVYGGRVHNTVSHSDMDTAREKASQGGVGEHDRQKTGQNVEALKQETGKAFESQAQKMTSERGKITQDYQAHEVAYNQRKKDGVVWSTAKRIVGEGENAPGVGVAGKALGDEANRIEDFGRSQSSYHKMKNPTVTGDSHSHDAGKTSTSGSRPSPISVEQLPPVKDAAPMDSSSPSVKTTETPSVQNTSSEGQALSQRTDKASSPFDAASERLAPKESPSTYSQYETEKVTPARGVDSQPAGREREASFDAAAGSSPYVSSPSVKTTETPSVQNTSSEGQTLSQRTDKASSPFESASERLAPKESPSTYSQYEAEKATPARGVDSQPAWREREASFDAAAGSSPYAPSSRGSEDMPSFKDATPPLQSDAASSNQSDVTSSGYVKTMEGDIDQSRIHHQAAAQGREIRQLKESMERTQEKPSDEELLDMIIPPKVES